MLALTIISLHFGEGLVSIWYITQKLVSGFDDKTLWAYSSDNIIEFIFQVCILYFCWGYSTRPKFQPIVEEEEEYTNVATEATDAIEEEEAYNPVET